MSDRVDYEHELGNGWNPWQNLILSAMKEIRDNQVKQGDDIQEIKVNQALYTQAQQTIKEDIVKLNKRDDGQDKEIDVLITAKDRVTGILAFFTIVIVPALVPVLINLMGSAF